MTMKKTENGTGNETDDFIMYQNEFYVYILKCFKPNSDSNSYLYYTGQTKNVFRRLQEHRSGKSTYTKRFIRIELVYVEIVPNRTEALQREKYIKSLSTDRKRKLIVRSRQQLEQVIKQSKHTGRPKKWKSYAESGPISRNVLDNRADKEINDRKSFKPDLYFYSHRRHGQLKPGQKRYKDVLNYEN